jgi:hypothetical protein
MNTAAGTQLVRVWLGPHAIAAYRADKDLADRYATAMGTQFGGLHITTENAADSDTKQQLPSDERQWPLTAFGGGGR